VNMVHRNLVVLLVIVGLCGCAPLLRPVLMYSGDTVIQIGTLDGYYIDLSCFTSGQGTLVVNVNQPDFQNTVSGVYCFFNNGASGGQFAPYPDPDDNTTYTWSTLNGTDNPLPGFSIPDAGGMKLYISCDAPDAENPRYTLVTKYLPNGFQDFEESLIPMKGLKRKGSSVEHKHSQNLQNIVQKELFFANQMELNGTVDYNKFQQYSLPMCQSALIAEFGNTPVCLVFVVAGKSPDFIFYQQVSTDPSPTQHVPKWSTRKPTPDPYKDFSGFNPLPINMWVSVPVLVKQIPSVLYHSVVGLGGNGLNPPWENDFFTTYTITTNCPQ